EGAPPRARAVCLLYAAHAAPQRRDPRWRLHLLGDQGICAGARAHPGLRAGGRGGWRALHAGALRSEIHRDGMAAEAAVPGLALPRTQGRAARPSRRRRRGRRSAARHAAGAALARPHLTALRGAGKIDRTVTCPLDKRRPLLISSPQLLLAASLYSIRWRTLQSAASSLSVA